jgi:hypothetical protein
MIRNAKSVTEADRRQKQRRASHTDVAALASSAAAPKRRRSVAEPTTLRAWAERVPALRTGRLDFDLFPFQREMYEVFGSGAKDVVVRKGTQVGASELMMRWALWEADVNGRTALYVFPTTADVYDWADARIAPLFERQPLLGRIGEPFNKGLRRVGPGLVFFRGSESKRKLDSVDCDAVAFDEYDTLNQRNIPDAERRLSSPLSAGLTRRVGVPSLPEYGISEQYDQSDRRKWLVRCESCTDAGWNGLERESGDTPLRIPEDAGDGWQEIDFWRNVKWDEHLGGRVIKNARRACEHCGAELDVTKGKWVAQQPESETPGFHISAMIAPNVDLVRIIRNSKKTSPYEITTFYNKDLGMPYLSTSSRLSPTEIRASQRELSMVTQFPGAGLVTMGVDVASARALNVRISLHSADGNSKQALWIGEVEDIEGGKTAFDQLPDLMATYSVKMCAIDSQPETRLARAFQAKCPGRVYLIKPTGPNMDKLIKVDDAMQQVSVKRTELMDATVEMIRSQNNVLPAMLPENYVSHLTSNVRHVKKKVDGHGDETGEVETKWVPTRADDYAFAEAYDMVATELYYWRAYFDKVERVQGYTTLDEVEPFRRSNVNRYDDETTCLGPDGDDSSHGFYEQW